MTKSTITREQLIKKAQEQIEFCRHTKITGEGRAHVNQCAALFEIALAAIDSEPVAWLAIYHGEVYDEAIGITRSVVEAQADHFGWESALTEIIPLYLHAQQPVVDADDNFYSWFSREWQENYQHNQYTTSAKQMLGVMAESAWKAGHRSAMLHAGNSPVIPDGYVLVPKEPTAEMIAAAMDCDDVLFNSDETFCVQFGNIYDAMIAAAPHDTPALNSVQSVITVPGKWIPVSERMPEMGEHQCYVLAADFKNHYWPNIPNTQVGVYGDWFDDGNPTWDDGDGEDLHLKEVTHWMPIPAAPQEVK